MRIMLSFLLFSLSFSTGNTQSVASGLSQLQWLNGTWVMETPRGVVHEIWTIVNDSTYHAVSYRVTGSGDTVLMEQVDLAARNGSLYYIPVVNGQNDNKPVAFRLIAIHEKGFVAENKEHDFPQQISYTQEQPGQLKAMIAGLSKGQWREVIFPYTRR